MSTTTTSNEKKDDDNTTTIQELRVTQTELVSGNTTGKVYQRLSSPDDDGGGGGGAVFLLQERSKVKADVATRLRKEILNERG